LWHLGVALERQDKKAEALSNYIKSYNSGDPDPVRRTLIEQLYRKINGSLDGLDERIGPAFVTSVNAPTPTPDKVSETVQPTSLPESTPAATPDVSSTPASSTSPEAASVSAPSSAEAPAAVVPQSTPSQSPTPSPEATPEPTPASSPEAAATTTPEAAPAATPESTPGPVATLTLETSPVEKLNKPPQTTVAITGRVKDSNGSPLANVVVVLISPEGTVLASTTDEQGDYSFTVASSSATRSHRVIPSKDGFAFEPVDRVLPIANDDVKELDFLGTPKNKP